MSETFEEFVEEPLPFDEDGPLPEAHGEYIEGPQEVEDGD
jgi:hypothetical protein